MSPSNTNPNVSHSFSVQSQQATEAEHKSERLITRILSRLNPIKALRHSTIDQISATSLRNPPSTTHLMGHIQNSEGATNNRRLKNQALKNLDVNLHNRKEVMRLFTQKARQNYTVTDITNLVTRFNSASVTRQTAMIMALEHGSETEQFVIKNPGNRWDNFHDYQITSTLKGLISEGDLADFIINDGAQFFDSLDFEQANSFIKLGLALKQNPENLGTFIGFIKTQPSLHTFLTSQLTFQADPKQIFELVQLFNRLNTTQREQIATSLTEGKSETIDMFLSLLSKTKEVEEQRTSLLINTFYNCTDQGKDKFIQALSSREELASFATFFPAEWISLDRQTSSTLLTAYTHNIDDTNGEIGTIATSSEAILEERSSAQRLIVDLGLVNVIENVKKLSDSDIDIRFNKVMAEIKGKIENGLQGNSLQHAQKQTYELALSFMDNKHFSSDARLFNLNLREAVVAITALGSEQYDNLNWNDSLSNSGERYECILNALITKFSDCRIANGDQPTCYEGAIERVVLSTQSLISLAPSPPPKGDYSAKFTEVANNLLEKIASNPEIKKFVEHMLISKNKEISAQHVLDLIKPAIKLQMSIEFPALYYADNTSKSEALFSVVKDHFQWLELPRNWLGKTIP